MASIPFEMSREEADREFDRLYPDRPQGAVRRLTQEDFDAALGKALRLCRLAADLGLPIAAMIEHVEDGMEAASSTGVEILTRPPSRGGAVGLRDLRDAMAELEALREIIATVGEVAAIGANLADEAPGVPPQPSPAAPPERSFPLPANLREA